MKRQTKIQRLHLAQNQIRTGIKTLRRIAKVDESRGRYAELVLIETLDHLVTDDRDLFDRHYSIAEWIDEIDKEPTPCPSHLTASN